MSVTLSLARARSKWKSAVVVPAKLHRALPMHMLVSGPRSVVTEISQTALPSSKNSRLSGHDSSVSIVAPDLCQISVIRISVSIVSDYDAFCASLHASRSD